MIALCVVNTADFTILSGNYTTSTSVPAGALSTVGNTIGYAGYVWDPALGGSTTGMYLARHRWFSPDLGRWVTKDPVGYSAGDMNLYGYVGGMPAAATDPMGLEGGMERLWSRDTRRRSCDPRRAESVR